MDVGAGTGIALERIVKPLGNEHQYHAIFILRHGFLKKHFSLKGDDIFLFYRFYRRINNVKSYTVIEKERKL